MFDLEVYVYFVFSHLCALHILCPVAFLELC